ncbi:DEKNAAC103906 [Brettanomyces naardenensis]|uniref:ATP-dependent DNA helicase n=1 Tax=Brettanomyces naardenensis TaxID=13370 RepID=A0A448YPF9_BRENA|nr:DEKNAAC103906 [Brettanomyces naardenensis]
MSSSSFSDDDDEVLLLTKSSTPSSLNKRSTVLKSGQRSLDGTTIYEEIHETNVSYSATHHRLNADQLSSIVYPTNLQVRAYQESIVKHALMENVLCALPTGLGKTFIASTVMLNYYRWVSGREGGGDGTGSTANGSTANRSAASTASSKSTTKALPQSASSASPAMPPTSSGLIIFMAPTRPLVAQQMHACYSITGIPVDDTAVLLDIPRKDRRDLWQSRRVFFATPQVVANDLSSGLVDPRDICCIIVDEAHRARGNYAYCAVIEHLSKINTSVRILALTATPGADVESVQQIVDNLQISRVDVRIDTDSDVSPYINDRSIVKIDCPATPEIDHVVDLISRAILPVLKKANSAGIYDITVPSRINQFRAFEKSRQVLANHSLPQGLKWTYYFQLRLLAEVGLFLRRLYVYGIKTFYSLFLDKYTEFTTKYNMGKSKNKMAATFYFDENVKKMKGYVEKLIADDEKRSMEEGEIVEGLFSHTKMGEMVGRVVEFLSSQAPTERTGGQVESVRKSSSDEPSGDLVLPSSHSSIIIFTEYRESALEIVHCLQSANKLTSPNLIRPHIFIGQAREKDKFDEETYRKGGKKGKKGKSNSPSTAATTSSDAAQSKGMSQKVQKELLSKFKSGVYNILVATSIGEEGLDIGEVDMIVCFDSTSSPIKNIQRMGRTGRKRAGNVVLLFSANERDKFDRAMDNYRWIQNKIRSADSGLELHPSDRIVPKEYNPEIVYTKIDIPEENEEILEGVEGGVFDDDLLIERAKKGVKKKGGKRRERQMKIEKKFYMPENVETGFRKASSMVKRRKVGESKRREEEKKKKQAEFNKSDEVLMSEDVGDESLSQLLGGGEGKSVRQEVEAKKVSKAASKPMVIDLSEFTDDELKDDEVELQETRKNTESSDLPHKPAGHPLTSSPPIPSSQFDSSDDSETIMSPSKGPPPRVSSHITPDPVFDNHFGERDGFMSTQQEIAFYSKEFTADENAYYDPMHFNVIDDPLICVRQGGSEFGRIPHSSVSESLIGFEGVTKRGNEGK